MMNDHNRKTEDVVR